MTNLTDIAQHYTSAHLDEEQAWDYLSSAQLSDKCQKAFTLGYASRSFGGALEDKQSKEGQRQRAELKKIGALRADSKPQLYGLTIPFRDGNGNVVDIYSYNFNAQKNAPKDLYLAAERKGFIWHGDGNEIVLVGAPQDTLALYTIGIETENTLLQNVAYCNETNDEGFRAKLAKLERIYLTADIEPTLRAYIGGLDCEVYQIHTTSLKGSFLDLLKSPQNARETITKIFQVPTLMGAPNRSSDNLESEKDCDVRHDEKRGHYTLDFANRGYRVTGLAKNKGYDAFQIRLKVWDKNNEDVLYHDDKLDLCAQKQRVRFAKDAAEALNENEADMKRELGKVLAQVEQIQEQRLTTPAESKAVVLSEKEKEAAEKLLKSPNLIEKIGENLTTCGITGESGLVAYLCGVSRLMERPLSAVSEDSRLTQRTLSFFPAESINNHTSLSEKALYYEGATKLQNQILCLESIKKGGAITQLVKNGRISQLTAIKDVETGGMMAQDFSLQCRPMLFLSHNDDKELEKLCLKLKGGVARENIQKKSSIFEICAEEDREELRKLHQNAQRLLKSWLVVNPFADQLGFPSKCPIERDQYLRLIESITLLHQLQRERKTHEHGKKLYDYIEVTAEDVKTANKLAANLFKTSSIDELPKHLRETFRICADVVTTKDDEWDKAEFTKQDILGTGKVKRSSLANHLKDLTKFDFVEKVSGGNGIQISYRLLIDPADLDGEALKLTNPDSLAA